LKQRHGRGLTLEADYPSQGVNVARRITVWGMFHAMSTLGVNGLFMARNTAAGL
jgi:hypothetical protein